MLHARRARRGLAAMACAVVVTSSVGCRSPFHRVVDGPGPVASEAVATIDRKDVPETVSGSAEASEDVVAAAKPAPEAIEPAPEPVPTPLLDAALRRAEAAEEYQRRAVHEAQAAIRASALAAPASLPLEATSTSEPASIASEAGSDSAAEPAPAVVEPADVPSTLESPPTTESQAEPPKSDPAVQPAAAEVEAEIAKEAEEQAEGAVAEPSVDPPTPPRPSTSEPEPTPEPPSLLETIAEASSVGDADGGAPVLTIEAAKLCRKIQGFGSYEPLKSNTLRPGRSALVYCELGGLEYREDGEGFVASVATRVELIRPADDVKVWEVADGAVDHSPSRRRDVYVGTLITLPDGLEPGEYALRLYQADSTSGRTASTEIPVTIAR